MSLSLLLAGDALMTRSWSDVGAPEFLQLIEEIRAADVAIVALETIIHEFEGYPQAHSGGIYMASPPAIAAELKWAGFDMVAHANNHTFDYGSSAVLETIAHVKRAGLAIAGSGRDLQEARAPQYVRCHSGTVALIAMASTFIGYGRASRSRADMPGRPGLNPLPLGRPKLAPTTRELVRGADLNENLAAIAQAASKADVVVVSLHAHVHGTWLGEFADAALEHGAHVIFVQGPHLVRGVELRGGRPVFHCLGDFVFEIEHIARHPAEAYEAYGLGADATCAELFSKGVAGKLLRDRAAFAGVVARLAFADGKVKAIRLLPVDLQFDAVDGGRGRPQFASRQLGERIIEQIVTLSREHNTQVRYDPATNCGVVELS
jgi:poly-gamma-glutamate synthesis protein (capsule biosynthesis protein)